MNLGVEGFRAGHVTGAGTGVTAVLAPDGTRGAAEVRGGAPATREFALLDPLRTVERVDAVVFTGGSAFGLAAADGVVAHLAARGQGFPTGAGPVPIVPAAAIFDLLEAAGPPPGAPDGLAAAVAADADGPLARGPVGAGAGASVGKWRGRQYRAAGGVGHAQSSSEGVSVAALAVVNALGDVVDPAGRVLAGSTAPDSVPAFPEPEPFAPTTSVEHTTLVAVVTDADLTTGDCWLAAQSAHHGLARAVEPSHTRFDGDLAVVLASGRVDASIDRLRILVTRLVAAAVRDAVAPGPPAGGAR